MNKKLFNITVTLSRLALAFTLLLTLSYFSSCSADINKSSKKKKKASKCEILLTLDTVTQGEINSQDRALNQARQVEPLDDNQRLENLTNLKLTYTEVTNTSLNDGVTTYEDSGVYTFIKSWATFDDIAATPTTPNIKEGNFNFTLTALRYGTPFRRTIYNVRRNAGEPIALSFTKNGEVDNRLEVDKAKVATPSLNEGDTTPANTTGLYDKATTALIAPRAKVEITVGYEAEKKIKKVVVQLQEAKDDKGQETADTSYTLAVKAGATGGGATTGGAGGSASSGDSGAAGGGDSGGGTAGKSASYINAHSRTDTGNPSGTSDTGNPSTPSTPYSLDVSNCYIEKTSYTPTGGAAEDVITRAVFDVYLPESLPLVTFIAYDNDAGTFNENTIVYAERVTSIAGYRSIKAHDVVLTPLNREHKDIITIKYHENNGASPEKVVSLKYVIGATPPEQYSIAQSTSEVLNFQKEEYSFKTWSTLSTDDGKESEVPEGAVRFASDSDNDTDILAAANADSETTTGPDAEKVLNLYAIWSNGITIIYYRNWPVGTTTETVNNKQNKFSVYFGALDGTVDLSKSGGSATATAHKGSLPSYATLQNTTVNADKSLNKTGEIMQVPTDSTRTTNYKFYFLGWDTKPDGTGDRYTDCQEVTFSESRNLYAQWCIYNTSYKRFEIDNAAAFNAVCGNREPNFYNDKVYDLKYETYDSNTRLDKEGNYIGDRKGAGIRTSMVFTNDIPTSANSSNNDKRLNTVHSAGKPFYGTLDGNNKTVTFRDDANMSYNLFGSVYNTSYTVSISTTEGKEEFKYNSSNSKPVVKKLTVKTAVTRYSGNSVTSAQGLIANSNAGSISECKAEGYFSSNSKGSVGGLVGTNSGTIDKCYSSADFDVTYSFVMGNGIGGIAGKNSGTISNCKVYSYITSCNTSDVPMGGIAGINSGYIKNEKNETWPSAVTGQIKIDGTNTRSNTAMGGVAGENSGYIYGYAVSSTITSSSSSPTGGIAGKNSGTITASNGYTSTSSPGTYCTVTGSVTNTNTNLTHVGGVAGDNTGTIAFTKVMTNVKGKGFVGGIVGLNTGNCKYSNYLPSYSSYSGSYTSYTVTGEGTNSQVGGIVGENRYGRHEIKGIGDSSCKGRVICCLASGIFESTSASGSTSVGGIIGRAFCTNKIEHYDVLDHCGAVGEVKGGKIIGGLVGNNFSTKAAFCYSAMRLYDTSKCDTLEGKKQCGGLYGYEYNMYYKYDSNGNVTGTVTAPLDGGATASDIKRATGWEGSWSCKDNWNTGTYPTCTPHRDGAGVNDYTQDKATDHLNPGVIHSSVYLNEPNDKNTTHNNFPGIWKQNTSNSGSGLPLASKGGIGFPLYLDTSKFTK